MKEHGIYRGGTGVFQVKFYSVGGGIVIPNPHNVTLKIYEPNGSLYQTVGYPDIIVEADGTTWAYIFIASDRDTGVWVAEWEYEDPLSGKIYKVEMPFIVSDIGYR